jgi:hypothetical protein
VALSTEATAEAFMAEASAAPLFEAAASAVDFTAVVEEVADNSSELMRRNPY